MFSLTVGWSGVWTKNDQLFDAGAQQILLVGFPTVFCFVFFNWHHATSSLRYWTSQEICDKNIYVHIVNCFIWIIKTSSNAKTTCLMNRVDSFSCHMWHVLTQFSSWLEDFFDWRHLNSCCTDDSVHHQVFYTANDLICQRRKLTGQVWIIKSNLRSLSVTLSLIMPESETWYPPHNSLMKGVRGFGKDHWASGATINHFLLCFLKKNFWALWTFIRSQLKFWTGKGGERGWHAVKSHRVESIPRLLHPLHQLSYRDAPYLLSTVSDWTVSSV